MSNLGRRPSAIGHRGAFSLIELLVVVSIISLLIALLLPSLQSARRVAWQAKCASNERQLVVGVMNYQMDNKGYLCWGALLTGVNDIWAFPKFLAPYVRYNPDLVGTYGKLGGPTNTVFHCPSDRAVVAPAVSNQSYTASMWVLSNAAGWWLYASKGYMTVQPFAGDGTPGEQRHRRINEFPRESSTFVFACSYTGDITSPPPTKNVAGWRGIPKSPYPYQNFNAKPLNWETHLGAANVSFLDGHVKAYKPEFHPDGVYRDLHNLP